jgi:hypothetical protein
VRACERRTGQLAGGLVVFRFVDDEGQLHQAIFQLWIQRFDESILPGERECHSGTHL